MPKWLPISDNYWIRPIVRGRDNPLHCRHSAYQRSINRITVLALIAAMLLGHVIVTWNAANYGHALFTHSVYITVAVLGIAAAFTASGMLWILAVVMFNLRDSLKVVAGIIAAIYFEIRDSFLSWIKGD